MKRTILVAAFTLAMVGCTNSVLPTDGGNDVVQQKQQHQKQYKKQAQTTKDQLVNKGLELLLNPAEINNGKTKAISLDDVSQGMLGAAGLNSLFGEKQEVAKIANMMMAHSGQVMETENPNMVIQAIKYLGQTEKGRAILEKGKYVFKNYSPVTIEQIQQLAELYKFRYAFM